jgi:hypothetical protein
VDSFQLLFLVLAATIADPFHVFPDRFEDDAVEGVDVYQFPQFGFADLVDL